MSRTLTLLAALLFALLSALALHAADAENRSNGDGRAPAPLSLTAEGRQGSPRENPYTDIYRAAVERRMREAATRREQTKKGAQEDISTACPAWMLAARTGEARYREFALELYDRFLQEKVDHDFHVSRPFGLVTLEMHKGGVLTGERRDAARRQARERITWFLDQRKSDDRYFDCNIALADTLAVACLARVFADDPELRAGEIRRTVAALGQRILETGDLNENASNYASLGICFFLELARLEGWLDDVRRSEHFRNMFARMRDIISPAGSIPEYGDGYFRRQQLRLDFVLLLEMAARLYNDASFQQAARRFLTATPELEEDQLHRGYLLLAVEPFTPTQTTQPALSAVQTRRIPGEPSKTVPDKLILRTGTQPEDAMIMIDLRALGSHAHEYKRPSVGFYEVGGAPLFHNLGRRGTTSGQCGNSFWILDRPEAFPGYPREKVWNTATVPADYCFPATEPGAYRIGDSLLLRNFGTPDLRLLRFDNLRLEGPKGALLLDGFESSKTWHSNVARHPGVRLESSRERTQAEFSQQVNWSIFGEQYCTRILEETKVRNTTFRLADYDTVKLDYQYEGQHPHGNLRALFDRWIDLGDRPLHCEVSRAEVRQLGPDAWGRVEFTDYNGPGNTLQRRLVLTREGVLVIADTFTAAPRCAGWAGGQLWQLYALTERGADWFASASDGAYSLENGSTADRRMLVKFLKAPDVTIDAERVHPTTMHAPKADGSRHREFFTTYSKRILSANQTTVSALAVLPMNTSDNAARLADCLALDSRADQEVHVTIRPPAVNTAMSVDISGAVVTIERVDAVPKAEVIPGAQ